MPEFDHFKLAAAVEEIRRTQIAMVIVSIIAFGVTIGLIISFH